jgi:hypothetical protein
LMYSIGPQPEIDAATESAATNASAPAGR